MEFLCRRCRSLLNTEDTCVVCGKTACQTVSTSKGQSTQHFCEVHARNLYDAKQPDILNDPDPRKTVGSGKQGFTEKRETCEVASAGTCKLCKKYARSCDAYNAGHGDGVFQTVVVVAVACIIVFVVVGLLGVIKL